MSDAAHRRDRRRFLKSATFAAAALASAPAAVFAAQAKSAAKPKPVAAPAAPAAPAAGATPPLPPISDDAKALAGVIQRRYGQFLTPEQLDAVTRQIDQGIQGGRRLRDVKFANGDEPDFTFKP
jgi:hypothetical protein